MNADALNISIPEVPALAGECLTNAVPESAAPNGNAADLPVTAALDGDDDTAQLNTKAPATNSLGALKKLDEEPARAYFTFLRFACRKPLPTYRVFAREIGLHANTVYKWKDNYRWTERLEEFYAAHGEEFTAFAALPTPPPATQPDPGSKFSLYNASLDLARESLANWRRDDQPITLPALVRLLQVTAKINGL